MLSTPAKCRRAWDEITIGKHALQRLAVEHFFRSFHRMLAARMLSADAMTGD
jgi:hypothetical protein